MSAKVHFVKFARKDNPVVKKGESYYWWEFRFGGAHYSKTVPKQSQLESSPYMQQMYSAQEAIDALDSSDDGLEESVNSITSDLENLKDELESSLENMPEQLQESSILNERIELLDGWITDLQSVDFEIDEDSIEAEARTDVPEDEFKSLSTDYQSDGDPVYTFDKGSYDEAFESRKQELANDARQEIIEAIQELTPGF